MSLTRIHTIEDLRRRAHARVPKVFFDYLDGGAGEETALRRNRSAWSEIKLYPRTMRDVTTRSLKTNLFGRDYAAPIGVAPVGLANLVWPGTDITLAKLAARANIPYILSTVGSTSIEDIAKVAPENAWFQLYMPNEDEILLDLLARADQVGMKVLAVTVDVPVPGSRYRDLRNGFSLPFRPSLLRALDIVRHPGWVFETLRKGRPDFATLKKYGGHIGGPKAFSTFVSAQIARDMSLKRMKLIRDKWPHKLVIKGILTVEDAEIAAGLGADGVIVSNHGGRQLDSAPAGIEVLGEIAGRVGSRLTVMLDGGIRTGSDIIKAYCLGAKYVFSGRSFVYGSAAAGEQGAARALDVLCQETSAAMALIGCTEIAALNKSYVISGKG